MPLLTPVVARHNEDISWLNMYLPLSVVYNKGETLIVDNPPRKLIQLENVGREADSYLRYIVNNYDNLPDYVFFTQGTIDDHVEDMKEVYIILKSLMNGFVKTDYYSFTTYRGQKFWKINKFHDIHHKLPLKKYWEMLFKDSGEDIMVSYCAVFVVSRERILTHSKSFYLKALEIANEPEGAYVLERFWLTMFNGYTK